jgi:hypothetical protein
LSIRTIVAGALAAAALASCSSGPLPFGYADDRCSGQQNQCQLDCSGLDDGPARSACIQRCFSVEDTCYASGYDGSGSSSAVDRAVGDARSRAEREAEYERWKAQRDRERAEEEEAVEDEQ